VVGDAGRSDRRKATALGLPRVRENFFAGTLTAGTSAWFAAFYVFIAIDRKTGNVPSRGTRMRVRARFCFVRIRWMRRWILGRI